MKHPSKEHSLLASLKPLLNHSSSPRYPLEIGDDAAIRMCASGERLVLTADTSMENVHFSLRYMTLAEVGYKAMATNVSDCAAMGALPDGALVQIIFPTGEANSKAGIKAMYRGFSKACREWNFPIIGGDICGGPCWGIAITMLGRLEKNSRAVLRSGARHGDAVWITGFPGRSAAGLEALEKWGRGGVPTAFRDLVGTHVRPRPRVAIGAAFALNRNIHAMMDLSDGVSKDAATLAWENKVGIRLDIPDALVPKSMQALARRLERPWQPWALHGGEDYELLFTATRTFDPDTIAGPLGVRCVRIGTCDKGVSGLVGRDGVVIASKSWDHCR